MKTTQNVSVILAELSRDRTIAMVPHLTSPQGMQSDGTLAIVAEDLCNVAARIMKGRIQYKMITLRGRIASNLVQHPCPSASLNVKPNLFTPSSSSRAAEMLTPSRHSVPITSVTHPCNWTSGNGIGRNHCANSVYSSRYRRSA